MTVEMNGREYGKGEELGHDCSGRRRSIEYGLGTEESHGLYAAVSSRDSAIWPRVSKSPKWAPDGGWGDWQNDWGRSEKERARELEKGFSQKIEKIKEWIDGEKSWALRKYRMLRAGWIITHPTWWEEKRREAEVDASSQVAGEMTDMNLDNRAIVAGQIHNCMRKL